MSEEIWAHLKSYLPGWTWTGWDCTWVGCAGGGCGQTNKRLSERSSHRATVNCQPWLSAEALLFPADKVALVRSAEPLHLCTRLEEEKEGLWLQRHPSGQGSVAALHHRSTTNWTSSTFLLSGHQVHLIYKSKDGLLCCFLRDLHVKGWNDASN